MSTKITRKVGTPTSVIGVDVDNRSLHAVQLGRRVDNVPQVPGWLAIPRHTRGNITPAEARALCAALSRAGFKGKDIVVNCRDEAVISAVLELPPRSARVPVEHLARMEMARIHRKDPKDFVLSMWETPAPDRSKRDGSMYAFVSAISVHASEEIWNAFEGTGYQVVGALPRCCSLARACAPLLADRAGLLGVVAINWDSTHIALLHADADGQISPVYERVIEEIGLSRLAAAFAQRLGVSNHALPLLMREADELTLSRPGVRELLAAARGMQSEFIEGIVTEVQRSFGYAVPLYPSLTFLGITVTGEGANLQGLSDRTAHATGVEVRCTNVSQLLAGTPPVDAGALYAIGGAAGDSVGGVLSGRAA